MTLLKKDKPIIIDQNFDSSAEKVWNAITNPKEMVQWFFDNIPSFRAEVGFSTRFAVESGNKTFTHLWKVTEVIPKQKISYNWKYEEYPGDSSVTFELFKEDGHTRLTLSMDITKSFPEGISEFTRESCIAGWNYFLGENLKAFLER